MLEAKLGPLPKTVTSHTGGGGEHRFFKYLSFDVKSDKAGKVFGPGVDLISDGAFIVGPRSRHVSGKHYFWLKGLGPLSTELVALPPKWVEHLKASTARADAPATPGSLADGAHDLPTIRRVRVDAVMIGNGRRACNPEQVRMIADSIAQIGLVNPITVTSAQTPADVGASEIGATVNLVAGLHRLEAHKLLGLTHVDAIVVASDRIDDRLREIAENLWRVELTVLERSELVEEWTKLIREKAGQVAHPGGFQPKDQGISRAAKELGLTREDVRRSKAVAGISPEAKAAAKAGHLSDNQKALLDIAKQPTPEAQVKKVREKVARKQTTRHKRNAKAAMATPPTSTPSASADTGEGLALPALLDRRDPEEVYASLKAAWANSPGMVAAWADAPPVVRERFIAEVLLNSATTTPALNALIDKTYKRDGLPRGEAGDE
jgi:ParB family chromosome partitioning protein